MKDASENGEKKVKIHFNFDQEKQILQAEANEFTTIRDASG